MVRIYALSAIAIVVIFLGFVASRSLTGDSGDPFADCRASQVAGGGADIGGPFTLVSETGDTVTEADVLTEPALIYFGYTFCPDVCPLDAARNADAVARLDDLGKSVTPVFITVDPARDTPAVLAEYTDYLHPRMIGLTGSEEQVAAASRAYRTYYQKQPSDDPDYYLMDHSTFTYLVLPGHGFVDFFRRDATAEDMAARTACFIAAAE